MIWQLTALSLTAFGAILFYLSNKNQRFFSQPINRFWRYLAFSCWALALLAWLQYLVISAAILIWLISIMAIQIIVPLLSLTKPTKV
ncbi:hypothetical protein GCM10009111_32450 [Colwellia asteriadis]|uniref:Uncharacterized protein n=1 Tax=Colwellia asteriadis TaxID=517723 RepID=A0ABN1LAR5_9GAMM